MRLKEIKPGMVIHCKNLDELKALLAEANRLGYRWADGTLATNVCCLENTSIKFHSVGTCRPYKYITWGEAKEGTEFSDLILPELTGEEVLRICNEICTSTLTCVHCPMDGNCFYENDSDYSKVIEICDQWKSDHEKKEPEIEWVYRVFGAENYGEKFFQTEDEAIKRCEELTKSQKTKQYARYERVCRVKAVE